MGVTNNGFSGDNTNMEKNSLRKKDQEKGEEKCVREKEKTIGVESEGERGRENLRERGERKMRKADM